MRITGKKWTTPKFPIFDLFASFGYPQLKIFVSGIGWQFYTHHFSWKTFIWQFFSWSKNGWFCLYGTYMQDWKADCLQLIFSLNLATPCLSTQQTLLILPCTNSPIMSLNFVTLVNLWFVLRPILLIQLEFTEIRSHPWSIHRKWSHSKLHFFSVKLTDSLDSELSPVSGFFPLAYGVYFIL